jgi:hypothetical protein
MVKTITLKNRQIRVNSQRARLTIPLDLINNGTLDPKKIYDVTLTEVEE